MLKIISFTTLKIFKKFLSFLVSVKLGRSQPGAGLQISLFSQPFDPPVKSLDETV